MNNLNIRTLPWLGLILIITSWSAVQPNIFVIGDSISMHYGPYLEQLLQGTAHYQRKQDDGAADPKLGVPPDPNGGDSRMVLEYLKVKTRDPAFKPDLILLNCGLHDIKRHRETNETQVSKEHYRQNLESIIGLLRETNIQIIWISTTPVIDSVHNSRQQAFSRYASDLDTYNGIADSVMSELEVPSIDLYNFTRNLGADQFVDHVHYTESARKLQGAFIAGYLNSYL